MDAVRLLESRAASVYWIAWRNVQVTLPRKDLPRVPEHRRTFGTRKSILSGSLRLAVNPANAMLNYLYTLLLAESSLAVAAMGLDPGLGYLHADKNYRDSLASNMMEPVRPQVDAFVFDWISGKTLKREWFFEQRNGNCRLGGLCVGPCPERTDLASGRRSLRGMAGSNAVVDPAWLRSQETAGHALTQRRNREEAQGDAASPGRAEAAEHLQNLRRIHSHRPEVLWRRSGTFQSEQIREAAKSAGTVAAHSAQAKALRSESMRRLAFARSAWDPSTLRTG
jgi:hypothetical protein